jgi:hypothetical protein
MDKIQTTQIDENVIEEVTMVPKVNRIDRNQLLSKKTSLENMITKLQSEIEEIDRNLTKFR